MISGFYGSLMLLIFVLFLGDGIL